MHQNSEVVNLRDVDGDWLCIGRQDTTYNVDGVVKTVATQADPALATVNVKMVEQATGGLGHYTLRHHTVCKLDLKGCRFIRTRIGAIADIGHHGNGVILYIPKHGVHQVRTHVEQWPTACFWTGPPARRHGANPNGPGNGENFAHG